MVEIVNTSPAKYGAGTVYECQGLSTDTKPSYTDMASQSSFYALDTNLIYTFSAGNAGTTSGWWEV